MNKIRKWGVTIGVVAASAFTVVALPSATASAAPTATYCWVLTDWAHDWEADAYVSGTDEDYWGPGIIVAGTGGSRSNGWTPVKWFWTGSAWASLLEGGNDTNDFFRTSALSRISC